MASLLSAVGVGLAVLLGAYVATRLIRRAWVYCDLGSVPRVPSDLEQFETSPRGQSVWYQGRWWRELGDSDRPQDQGELMMTPGGRAWRPVEVA